MTNAPARRRRTSDGAAAVEFAIVLPLLLLLVAGIVDFGRAMFTQIEITNAAREGARAAIAANPTAADVEARAEASAPGVDLNTNLVACAGAGSNASVTVTTSFDWILLGPAVAANRGSIGLADEFTATAVMRCNG